MEDEIDTILDDMADLQRVFITRSLRNRLHLCFSLRPDCALINNLLQTNIMNTTHSERDCDMLSKGPGSTDKRPVINSDWR